MSPPTDPQGVRAGVPPRAPAEGRGGQQVPRLRLRRHLGDRQDPDPRHGATAHQAAAREPQLHRGRPRGGTHGAGRHERDQLQRRHREWRAGVSWGSGHDWERSLC